MPEVASEVTTIRPATAADVPACVAMGLRFLHLSEYRPHFVPDAMALERLAHFLIAHGVILLVDKGAGPVGMLGLLPSEHLFTGRPYVGELFYWVDPEHRGCGVRLLRAGESWARAQGAESIQMVAPNGAVATLYGRLGYTALETNYLKAL